MAKKFFIKLVTDPDVDLRKCIVGLACASQAINDGHDVSMFFAANGAKLLHAGYMEQINAGGMLPDNVVFTIMETITSGARRIYCSTGSQAANGVTKENADGHLLEGFASWMTWSGPPGVIELSADADVQLVY